MLRRLFTSRKRPASASRSSVRLCLEPLEKREVLDAALTQGLSVLAVNAYQAAQQMQQAQTMAQADLTQFKHDAASFSAGQSVSGDQISHDLTLLHQDAGSIQNLNAAFQNDVRFFVLGVLANQGNLSSNDAVPLFGDAMLLQNGDALATSALQTAEDVSSVQMPTPPASPLALLATKPTAPDTKLTPTPGLTTSTGSSSTTDPQLVTLTLNPLNVNLLGLNVQTSKIQINIAAQQGNGDLLGNLLGDTSNLLNLPAVSGVVNTILGNVVTLVNSGSLSLAPGTVQSGSLSTPAAGATSTSPTSVLTLHVAPVTLNLMGAVVTTSPIDLTLTAQSGQGLVLGNVVSDLANLFNPPLPQHLSLAQINGKLDGLLAQLNQQLPNVGTPPPPVNLAPGQFLAVNVSPINLNLLGLLLQTSPIQINATNQTGNGDLLGNIGTTLLNTVDATPQNLTTFNNDLNAILAKVIGALNGATLTVPSSVVSSLDPVLQQLTSPTLVNTSGTPATVPILNLAIASPTGGTPVNVDLLGLDITTSNIQVQLNAQTGTDQILGNLLYNLANLLNPGGTASLLPILTELGL